MAKVVIYPRLYVGQEKEGYGVVISEGDAIVGELWEKKLNPTINTFDWGYTEKVLESAIRLFGNFEDWLTLQRQNPKIVGYNLEFLVDTLRFIRTGQRELSIATWEQLLTEATGPQLSPLKTNARPSDLQLLPEERKYQIFKTWLSKPNGVTDMIQTLHLVFGHSRDVQL